MAPVLRHCPCLRPENDDVRLLDYSHSNLEDVPNEVFGFERTLEELYLDANQIKDLPRPLFHCHGLRKLNLSDNEVQTLPPAVASLINLEQLDISKNGVLEIPDNIKGCKCLNMIDASVNPLGKLPEGFTQLINLQELYLNDTFLEYLPANFGRLSRLKILELRENHLKVLPKSMARLTELHRLDIGQNDFVDLPEVIGNLPRLVELWCDCNNLTCLPPFLGGLKKLAYLDASKNRIYDIADEIEGCISLCDLTLSTNRIKVLPEGIANLKKITVMRVDENRLVHLPANIGNLCNLEELVMSSNDLTKMPCSVGLLRSLRTLIADDNLLEELPSEMGSCLKLTILSLRDNKLVQIPDELGHITSLKVINFSGNLLQYLPFSIAKLPNLQALWLSENQNKPLIPLQSDTEKETGQKVLTCFMLPQVPLDEEVREVDGTEGDAVVEGKSRHLIKFAFDAEKDQPSKLIRAPTPYPKELKAHARHARNYALKKQGSKDSEGNEMLEQNAQHPGGIQALQKGVQLQTTMTPDIMILPLGAPENRIKVKEAIVTKPKSPVSSPSLQERHKVLEQKADLLNEAPEILQHVSTEENCPKISQEDSLDNPSEVPLKVLGRRDSRGDGSSSERSSASPAGSPKSAAAKIHSDPRTINEKEGKFKKNTPVSGSKRETWMRQRLLRQGSGDSDRGYRSDHEVYLAERDQYGQFYPHHDGYASDWEAFLSKQNYPSGTGPVPIVHQYIRPPTSGELGYRGNAEGQEISDGERSYWDPGYHYTEGNEHGHVDERHQTRIPSHQGYWQMDPSTGVYYDTGQPYQSVIEGNKAYFYPREEHMDVPLQPQIYYPDASNYPPQPPPPQPPQPPPSSTMWLPRHHSANSPRTLPKRLSDSSPRLKRSQCISVQAPLHSHPQEYHLMPQVPSNVHHPTPGSSPRPGRSPSPRAIPVYPNSVAHPKYASQNPHLQPKYPGLAFPVTTQPVNSVHLPPPTHMQYYNSFDDTAPTYPVMPPSPRLKHVAQPYVVASDESMQSYNAMPPAGIHSSIYYSTNRLCSNNQTENCGPPPGIHQYLPASRVSQCHQDMGGYQDYNYGDPPMHGTDYRVNTGADNQCYNDQVPVDHNCGDYNYSERRTENEVYSTQPVPSINIIPSTSPPQTSYLPSSPLEKEVHKDSTSKDVEVLAKAEKGKTMTEVLENADVTNVQTAKTCEHSLSEEKSTSLSTGAVSLAHAQDNNAKQETKVDSLSTVKGQCNNQVIEPSKPTSDAEQHLVPASHAESVAKNAKNMQNSSLMVGICKSSENEISTKICNSSSNMSPSKTSNQNSVGSHEVKNTHFTSAQGRQIFNDGSGSKVSNSQEYSSKNMNQPSIPIRYGTYKATPITKNSPNNAMLNSSAINNSKPMNENLVANNKSINTKLEPNFEHKALPMTSNAVDGKCSNNDSNVPTTVDLETTGNSSTVVTADSRHTKAHVVKNAFIPGEADSQLSAAPSVVRQLPSLTSNQNTNIGKTVQNTPNILVRKGSKVLSSKTPETTFPARLVADNKGSQSLCEGCLHENKAQSTKLMNVKNANLIANSEDFRNCSQSVLINSATSISSLHEKQKNSFPNVASSNQTNKENPLSKNVYSYTSVPGYPVQVTTARYNDPSLVSNRMSMNQGKREHSNKELSTNMQSNQLKTHTIESSADTKNISSEGSQKNIVFKQLSRQHSKEETDHPLVRSSLQQHTVSISKRNSKNSQDILNANDISRAAASVPLGHSTQYVIENKDNEKSRCIGSDNSSETPVSNKRFQKVLPPFDKTHHLKPSGTRNPPPEDTNLLNRVTEKKNDPDVTHVDEGAVKQAVPAVPERSDSKQMFPESSYANVSPAVPPKKNVPLSTAGQENSCLNKPPPLVPPKPASMLDASQPPLPPHPKTNLKNNVTVNQSQLYSKVESEKTMDNEVNESLQSKNNMPDLLSRIGPEEKEQMLSNKEKTEMSESLHGDEDKPLKILGNDPDKILITDQEISFTQTNEKNIDSPKSPKRNSWLFGTHKNSLVFPVIIVKSPGLGFSIEGGIGSPRNPHKPQDDGIYVAQVSTNGPAFSTLRSGDKILQADGVDFTKLDHCKAIAVLQDSGPSVSLMVSRE